MPRASAWTPQQDDKLRQLWAENMHVDEIGLQLGRRHTAIYIRAHRLELPARKGVSLSAELLAQIRNLTAIPQTPNRDDEYVAACLAQGGFKVLQVEYRR